MIHNHSSLRKTSHFLTALARTLPSNSTSSSPPVTYHALDLSHPELVRTLDSLEVENKDVFAGKIKVGGLWGDYERGIEFVKNGGLAGVGSGAGDSGTNGNEADKKEESEKDKTPVERPKEISREKSDYFGPNGSTATPLNGASEARGRITESPAPCTPTTSTPAALPSSLAQLTEDASSTLSQRRNSRPLASPLLLPRTTHNLSRSQSGPKRRTSMSSLNSFSLDDGPLVELQDHSDTDETARSETSAGAGPKVKGVRHAGMDLDPVGWKRDSFKDDILGMLRKLVSCEYRRARHPNQGGELTVLGCVYVASADVVLVDDQEAQYSPPQSLWSIDERRLLLLVQPYGQGHQADHVTHAHSQDPRARIHYTRIGRIDPADALDQGLRTLDGDPDRA